MFFYYILFIIRGNYTHIYLYLPLFIIIITITIQNYMKAEQKCQLDNVKLIIYHQPHIVQTIGYIHPLASLFQHIPNFIEIKFAYQKFKTLLKKYNIHYAQVTDVLKRDKKKLIQLAKQSCKYSPDQALSIEKPHQITQVYKDEVLEKLDIQTLISLVYSRPKIYLKKERYNTFISIQKIQINPLSNLIFIRDQQIITSKGLVIGNTATTVRKFQSIVMKKCFQILKIKPIGICPEGCYIQGGDFIPLKKDIALLNIGLRSNIEGAKFLMDHNLIGTKRFGIVKDEGDKNQQRMHLDTIFNVINEQNVMLLDFKDQNIPENARRTIDIYQQNQKQEYEFKFNKDFETFLIEQGYKIVKVSDQDQRQFMLNFLNIGKFDQKYVLLTTNPNFQALMAKHQIQNVTVEYTQEFKEVNKLYGSFHCATQVFR